MSSKCENVKSLTRNGQYLTMDSQKVGSEDKSLESLYKREGHGK